MNFWNNFAAKHPAAAKWVREGGLFVIVSNNLKIAKRHVANNAIEKAVGYIDILKTLCSY